LKVEKAPGDVDSANNGQGTVFRWQRLRKSLAYFEGSIKRLAWMKEGARPEVNEMAFFLAAKRVERPVMCCVVGALEDGEMVSMADGDILETSGNDNENSQG